MQRELITTNNSIPALYAPDAAAARRTLEFFTAHIRNPNTRRAYAHAANEFAVWCNQFGIQSLNQVQPVHVAAYVENLSMSAPSIKIRLAAIRTLFDWLVVGQVIPSNPASSVRGPKHVVKKGKTPALTADETRALLNTIDTSTAVGLRDRALIGLMVFTFARVGAAIKMQFDDVYMQGRRLWVRLHEKGGKQHDMPCHHHLEDYLHAYINEAQLDEGNGFLFRSAASRSGELSERPLAQSDVYRMIRRRATEAGIQTKIGCHSFRATGITEFLRNGGKLEIAQQMANHESARTTSLYDRRGDEICLSEVERIII